MHYPSSQADGFADLSERVHAEISAVLDLMAADVTPGALLREHFGVTEHDRTQLRVAISRAFDLYVPIEVLAQWKQVSDVTHYVETRLAAQGPSHA